MGLLILDYLGWALAMLVGLVMVGFGTWGTFHAIRQVVFWPKATATLVRYWISRSGGEAHGQPFFHAVLQFRTNDGESVTAVSRWGSWRRAWPRGQLVTVRYNPVDPRWAEIACFGNVWGMPLTCFALTTILVIVFFFDWA